MNKIFEAKLSMYQTASEFELANDVDDVADARPILTSQGDELRVIIDAIIAQALNTEVSSAASTANKAMWRETMVSQAIAIANMTYAYGVEAGNPNLIAISFPWRTKSQWDKLKDQPVGVQAQLLLNQVTDEYAIQTALIPYGWVQPAVGPPIVTGTDADLQAAIDTYTSVVSNPEETIEGRKAANIILANLFEQADTQIAIMTATVYAFQFSSDEDLFNYWIGWKAATTIIGPMTMHTKIKGQITSALTSLPIQGVRVRMIPTPIEGQVPPAQIVEVYTNEFGNYTGYTPKFKNVPYTIIWTKTGYAEVQTTDIFVKLGKATTIDVIMEPLP